MYRHSVVFTAPSQVSVCEEALPEPAPDQVLVQTLYSAISPGTELLVYRGQFPEDLPIDESIPSLAGEFRYPLRYGYSAVGRIIAAGSQVDPDCEGRLVFAFQAHTSHFLATLHELMALPADIQPEEAVFLPNMETAVNLVMDGAPLIGEHVAVFGQGVVGLLTTALLAQFPLSSLVTLDRYPLRRKASLETGTSASLDPEASDVLEQLRRLQPEGADLVYELSGSPAALDQAIAAAAYSGRVVVGSWYGSKRATLDLGGRFHRSRIRLISSQVSSLAPELSGRWTKRRRFEVAWEMVRRVKPRRFITHRLPLSEAPRAYQLLDQSPEEAIQVLFKY
jgi:2-desacetyl-2-hydroxyethyl bacteriochlorophyllide A dehydrogenase